MSERFPTRTDELAPDVVEMKVRITQRLDLTQTAST